jgi:hypothetical protein
MAGIGWFNPSACPAELAELTRIDADGPTDPRCPAQVQAEFWCMMWCMKRTNIYLAEGQAAALDRAAAAEGVSRAELIRELINRAIGANPGADLTADLAAINDSFGILAGQEAFSRTRDQRMDYLDRLADA